MNSKPWLSRIAGAIRANGGQILVEALVNFILPFAIYTLSLIHI